MTTASEAPVFDAEKLIRLGRVTAAVPSPDGTWIAAAVSRLDADGAKYVSDLWRVPMDGGEPVKLTRGDVNDRAPCFRRDGALGFLSNRDPGATFALEKGDDGTKRAQVWVLPLGVGGEPYAVTDEPLGVSEFRFAPEGDVLIVLADVFPGIPHDGQRARARELEKKGPTALHYRTMPVRYWDHWFSHEAPHFIAYHSAGGGRRDLTPAADREHREGEWDLSRDGAALVVTTRRAGSDRLDDVSLGVIDTRSGRARMLDAGPGVTLESPRISPDGSSIVCTHHRRGREAHGRIALYHYDVASGQGRDLCPRWDCWPHPQGWTRDGARVLVTADDRGSVPVFTVDPRSGEVTRVTSEKSGGSHEHVSEVTGANSAVGLRHRLQHPPEVFRVELRAGAEPELVSRLSGFTPDDGAKIAQWTSQTVKSSDGRDVQYFKVVPATTARAGGATKLPVLLWIHGGPRSQWADAWHWRWNSFAAAARGYAVILPNPRGSTGFGQEFMEGVWNRWGDQVYRDVIAVADAAASSAEFDGARMAAMGGSFGGYMTNWIGGHTDRFRCLVTHASVYWLSSFHGVTDLPAWWALEMGAGTHEGAMPMDTFSPHVEVGNWKSPTLVVHGEKDYRVPVSEALALFEALQSRGVPSELLIFPDEGHWILRPRNVVAWYETVLGYLDRYLR